VRQGLGSIEIETTRPEMLASCVALVAHPDDKRFQALFGTTALTPLFGVEVPILAHELADPDKGSGVAMICTFGDTTDIIWWRELQLPTRALIGRDGRFLPAPFGGENWPSRDADAANAVYSELEGKTINQVRAVVVEKLRDSGALIGELRAITHPVKFYERGERPLEIVTSRQWFVSTLATATSCWRAASRSSGTRTTCATATSPGSRASTSTGTSRASGSSACPFRSGIPRTRTASSTSIRRSWPHGRRSARRPLERRARGIQREPAQPARTASWATPTSWTPGRRVH
jgi:valyl-tRNA synthetase